MPVCTIIPNVLNKEECQTIIEIGLKQSNLETGTAIEGAKYGKSSSEMRDCMVSWLSHDDKELGWLYKKTLSTMRQANEANWEFTLDGELEHSQFTVYYESNHFDWHTDNGDGDLKFRKLTSTMLLNDPNDYSGGDLELSAPLPRPAPRMQGAMIIFPTYTLHRVTPVLSGTRYSLVQWMSGKQAFT